MKKIGFIGAYDKIDMILNIAKILTEMSKKALVVDFTKNQKSRYIVPAINPTKSYITSFENIDVAIGFENTTDIMRYLSTEQLPYDFMLLDIDRQEGIEQFDIKTSQKNYFVTSFDIYNLKKGLEILANVNEPLYLTKILYSKDMIKEEDDYLNYLSLGARVQWSDIRIYFPIENGDLSVIMENQRVQKIKFKRLSQQYKEGLIYICQDILDEKNDSTIRRVMKNIEKGV